MKKGIYLSILIGALVITFQNCSEIQFEELANSKLVRVQDATNSDGEPTVVVDNSTPTPVSEPTNNEVPSTPVVDNNDDSKEEPIPVIVEENEPTANPVNEDTPVVKEDSKKDNKCNDDDVKEHKDHDKTDKGLLVECLLQGNGKNNVVGVVNELLQESGNRGSTRVACMSVNSCQLIKDSGLLPVVSALKSMRCNNNSNSVKLKLTDEQVQLLIENTK